MDVAQTQAQTGLDFNFTYASGITDQQILGVELAGEMWSNYLGDTHHYIDDDDVLQIEKTTINIHVQVTSDLLPDNVIAGAFPAIYKEKYEDVYDALTGDKKTSIDQLAIDTLFNNSSSFDNKKTQILVNGKVDKNDKLQFTGANLKALNLIDVTKNDYQKLDGYIVLSDLSNFSSAEWNYDYLEGPKAGTLDFLTTVTHELGHTLGFISGTDRTALNTEVMGYYQRYNPVDVIEQARQIADDGKYAKLDDSDPTKKEKFKPQYESKDKDKFLKDQGKFVDALEVLQNVDDSVDSKEIKEALKAVEKYLKYDESWETSLKEDSGLLKNIIKQFGDLEFNKVAEKMTSLDLFRYSTASSDLGANDITRGSATYFSLDGSQTDLAMSNGQDYQGSHWQNREESLGVMNPTVTLNKRFSITGNDLMALDAIGWDVNYNQSMDMQALYDQASAAVANAWIGDRTKDVEKIIYGDAYDARRSRRSSYRGLLSGGFSATAGYFSTFSSVTDSSNFNSEEVACDYSCVSRIDNWVVITNNRQSLQSLQFDSFNRATGENDNTADNSDNDITLAENLSKEEDSDNSNHNSTPLNENRQTEGDSDKSSTPSHEIKRKLCEEKLYEEIVSGN